MVWGMVWGMARPEHAPVDSLAVAPVGQEVIGTLAWSPPAGSWHPDGVEHHRELRAVVALPRGYDHRQGPPLPVAGEVHLGGKPVPSSPERFLGGVLYPPFSSPMLGLLRVPEACWCARTTVESTLTNHSSLPTASLLVCTSESSLSQVPSRCQRTKRS
jgi:hypothetical protein